jgi:hypothetical protein
MTNYLYKQGTGKSERDILIPKCLECHYFMNTFIICCRKRKWFVEYEKQINNAKFDINRNLDLVSFLKRLRMHGVALTILFDKPSRYFVSQRAINKNIENIDRK